MLKYVTSLFLIFGTLAFSQKQPVEQPADSLQNKKQYGLRVGLDLASLLRTGIDEDYTGFQILGDYRLTDRLYVAAELGNESLQESLERVDFETSGSFIKAGIDFNFYQNWLEMDNMIYAGLRVGYANTSQTLNRYRYSNDNNYFPSINVFTDRETTGLNMFWLELQAGVKVQVWNNFYLMANMQLRRLVSEDQPDNFDNLYIPGYGRTYDTGEIGAGFTYGILYRIPLYKK